ncbi:hypothetical protein HUA74_02655 [Myxococcus sp. CA051A]|uniref:hypothetical protein n=1 Tax=Myxococcus sp. CA051A TaxID=2741739 RepID=UPI00157A8E39|nr:hypothetical protein [Myxococcus sp. CA051A]NTX59554.1 hypothetical protein [Myxococcus sp. CA051A]
MPIKNGVVECINHPDQIMLKNAGLNAITAMEAGPQGLVFQPMKGIPITVYSCPECGYMESYLAKMTPHWEEALPAAKALPLSLGKEFEDSAMDALWRISGKFGATSVNRNVPVRFGSRIRELDALLSAADAVYVFEFQVDYSHGVVGMASLQLSDAADMLARVNRGIGDNRPIKPILVVPVEVGEPSRWTNIPVLKFDRRSRQFVNVEAVLGFYGK